MLTPAITKKACEEFIKWLAEAPAGDEIIYYRILIRVTASRPKDLFKLAYEAAAEGRVFLFQRHKEGAREYVARKARLPEALRPRDPSTRNPNGEW